MTSCSIIISFEILLLDTSRHSGYSFVLMGLLFLVFSYRDNIKKTDFNQMNNNLNEKSIQNALCVMAKVYWRLKFEARVVRTS
jgi:hypothetical protein